MEDGLECLTAEKKIRKSRTARQCLRGSTFQTFRTAVRPYLGQLLRCELRRKRTLRPGLEVSRALFHYLGRVHFLARAVRFSRALHDSAVDGLQ